MEIPKRKDTQMLGEVNITKTSPPTTVQGIYHLNIHNSWMLGKYRHDNGHAISFNHLDAFFGINLRHSCKALK